jgi:hypothetical protein
LLYNKDKIPLRGRVYGKYRDSDSFRRKGRRPTPDRTLTVSLIISQELKDLLDSEKLPTERYNDTILRMLRERTEKIAELRRQVDVLIQTPDN